MRIPLGTTDYSRTVAQNPPIRLLNRFFEENPTNQADQVSLLCRPGLRKWLTVGTGPIRAIYSQPGTFDECLFVVSADEVYRVDRDETTTLIGTLPSTSGAVSMAATDTHLFIADGQVLKYYTTDAFAIGTLTAAGAIATGDQVRIGANYYEFTDADVDAGAPQGTSSDPWLVALGSSNSDALQNLANAIDGAGDPGDDYSSALQASSEVTLYSVDATTLVIRAWLYGSAANSLATTETGANLSWGAATLTGGGASTYATVDVPDGDGVISVGVIAGYTICVIAQGQDKNGRFYWIEPGETTIDALNFATAERSPDPTWQVEVVGDQFWLPGASTNEVWYPSGDGLAPFVRQQGRLFDEGIWEGTILKLKNSVYVVGNDGVPYEVTDAPRPIGGPGIVERFRKAINAQRSA